MQIRAEHGAVSLRKTHLTSCGPFWIASGLKSRAEALPATSLLELMGFRATRTAEVLFGIIWWGYWL